MSMKKRSGSSIFLRRAKWVIRCGAFTTKRNSGGVAASHPAIVFALGMR
jgi:hypothetical protein